MQQREEMQELFFCVCVCKMLHVCVCPYISLILLDLSIFYATLK